MLIPLLALLLTSCRACAAAPELDLRPHDHSTRDLLGAQRLIGGTRPAVCAPLAGPTAQVDPICAEPAPGGKCWQPCGAGASLASDGVRCILPCPKGWSLFSSSDDGVVCKRCLLKTCRFVLGGKLTPARCVEQCGEGSVSGLRTRINGVCCGPCPRGAFAIRGSTSCRQLVTGAVVNRVCLPPAACNSRIETRNVPSVPRPSDSPACPQGALGTLSAAGLQCWSCVTGAPYREIDGTIKCSTGACPAGYQACGDDRFHCWDQRDRLIAYVFEMLQDRKACVEFLRKLGYAGCLRPCPAPIVIKPPIVVLDPTG